MARPRADTVDPMARVPIGWRRWGAGLLAALLLAACGSTVPLAQRPTSANRVGGGGVESAVPGSGGTTGSEVGAGDLAGSSAGSIAGAVAGRTPGNARGAAALQLGPG